MGYRATDISYLLVGKAAGPHSYRAYIAPQSTPWQKWLVVISRGSSAEDPAQGPLPKWLHMMRAGRWRTTRVPCSCLLPSRGVGALPQLDGDFRGILHLLWPFTYYAKFIPKIYSTQSKAWNKNNLSLKMWKSHFPMTYAADNLSWLQVDGIGSPMLNLFSEAHWGSSRSLHRGTSASLL